MVAICVMNYLVCAMNYLHMCNELFGMCNELFGMCNELFGMHHKLFGIFLNKSFYYFDKFYFCEFYVCLKDNYWLLVLVSLSVAHVGFWSSLHCNIRVLKYGSHTECDGREK